MKITIGVDDLAGHLKKFELIKQTYSHQSECVCITTGEDIITLSATDGSVSLSTTIPCSVEASGSMIITCKQLSKLLEVLPAREAGLAVLDDGNRLQIKTVTGEYLLHTTNLEARPETTFKEENSLNIEGKILLDGVSSTMFSASSDDTKKMLCGVNLQTNGVLNRFCATTSYHLSTYEADSNIDDPDNFINFQDVFYLAVVANELNNNYSRLFDHYFTLLAKQLKLDFLVTNKVCRLLTKLLSPQDKVSITLGNESYIQPNTEEVITYEAVILKFGNIVIKYSLANVGMFPRYDQLIPRQFERKALVDRAALVAAVENISVIAQQKNNVVKLAISKENQEIRLSCKCDDVGASEVKLPAQVSGDNLTCAFNLPYLLGGLKSFSNSEVSFSLNVATTPVIIEPLSVQKRKFLIMPVELGK